MTLREKFTCKRANRLVWRACQAGRLNHRCMDGACLAPVAKSPSGSGGSRIPKARLTEARTMPFEGPMRGSLETAVPRHETFTPSPTQVPREEVEPEPSPGHLYVDPAAQDARGVASFRLPEGLVAEEAEAEVKVNPEEGFATASFSVPAEAWEDGGEGLEALGLFERSGEEAQWQELGLVEDLGLLESSPDLDGLEPSHWPTTGTEDLLVPWDLDPDSWEDPGGLE